jgi:phosphoribosylanthranilate isomerase
VKICGCRKPADAIAAADARATYAGVVFAERLRRVTPAEAAEILAPTRGKLRAVGVFVDASHEEILAARDMAGLHIAQLHGAESPEQCRDARDSGLEVWKALRPRSREELATGLERYAGAVDAILVEGFSAAAAGGTGTAFPIEWLAPVRERLAGDDEPRGPDSATDVGGRPDERPAFVLAGGLTPENVRDAIRRARPSIVDVSSGVECGPGEKDVELIARFVSAARSS